MADDPSSKRIILFGGMTGTTRFNDTWTYDPAANAWKELKPAGAIPSPRGGQSMDTIHQAAGHHVRRRRVPDDALQRHLGLRPRRQHLEDLKPAGTLPSGRGGQGMATVPTSRRLIVFGGADDTGSFRNDVWALSP